MEHRWDRHDRMHGDAISVRCFERKTLRPRWGAAAAMGESPRDKEQPAAFRREAAGFVSLVS